MSRYCELLYGESLSAFLSKVQLCGTSLVLQWLRLCTVSTGDEGSIPGGGTKIPQVLPNDEKKKKAQLSETSGFSSKRDIVIASGGDWRRKRFWSF